MLKQEHELTIFLRKELAFSHITIRRGPRISLSVLLLPNGIEWGKNKEIAKVVFLFLTAEDTHGTYRKYLAEMAKLFRFNVSLQSEIANSQDSRDVIRQILSAEHSMIKVETHQ